MPTNASGLAPFETDRLLGRAWTAADAEAAFAIYGDPDVMKGLGAAPQTDLQNQAEWIGIANERYRDRAYGTGFWALVRKLDNRIVGAAVVKPIPEDEEKVEIGWHLAKEFWGHGYATEGASEAIRIAFQNLPIEVLYALVMPWNTRSLSVAERLGFERGASTRRYYDTELIVHTLNRDRWRAG